MAPPALQRLFAAPCRHVAALSQPALGALVLLHLSITRLAFLACGEEKAAAPDTFW